MTLEKINNVFFVGIGGIGMSALARYFKDSNKSVMGYDKTETALTNELITEKINVIFNDNISLIEQNYLNPNNTLVVYTPAIPKQNLILNYFINNKFNVTKRAEILGFLLNSKKGIAISGTHGKTSITTLISYLFLNSDIKYSSFIGGISKNFNSNLILNPNNEYVIAEADEFDRSFLKLFPQTAVVTSIDADHLDIYGKTEELKLSFEKFITQIEVGGNLVIKYGLNIKIPQKINIYTYSLTEKADYYPENIRVENNIYTFELNTPKGKINNIELGVPGLVNVENAIAAIAVAQIYQLSETLIKQNLKNFKGVKRRFDYIINTEKLVFIDDYAHHPEELKATILSIKNLYKNRKITGIFQPHLFSRTRDFAEEFAKSLSMLDELILLDIYPARELPIDGVTSEIIFKNVTITEKTLCTKTELLEIIKLKKIDILLTLGAGDIDAEVPKIKHILEA
jgi:UDP-N-acetylmuramate--alanine ligase